MVGIVAYGAYVPRLRLSRQAVYDANKWFAAGLRGLAKGERSMANWDEDSITMAVEASRDCLTSHKPEDVRSLYFASTTHPFKDRQNAGVIGTALSIEQNLLASDVERLHVLITRHAKATGSKRAAEILANWAAYLPKFRKVMPVEYRRALREMKAKADAEPQIAIGA